MASVWLTHLQSVLGTKGENRIKKEKKNIGKTYTRSAIYLQRARKLTKYAKIPLQFANRYKYRPTLSYGTSTLSQHLVPRDNGHPPSPSNFAI